MKSKISLIGEVFGKLTVIGRLPNRGTHSQWKCICACGNEKGVLATHLRRGAVTSCGCSMIKHGSAHVQWTGIGEMSGYMWNQIRRNGDPTYGKTRKSRQGIDFTITKEYVWELFVEQDRKCALSGMPLQFATFGNRDTTASLDRIDNKKGYVPGNVQWLHKDINKMKNVHNQAYFIEMCRLVAERS